MKIVLNSQQEKIVAAGVTTLGAGIVVAAIVILFAVTAWFFQSFSHVFLPLAVAGVLAMVLDPWYEWLKSRGLPGAMALMAVFASLIVPIAAILVFFGTLIVSQFGDLLDQLPAFWEHFTAWLRSQQPNISRFFSPDGVGAKITEALQSPNGPAADAANYVLSTILSAGNSIASGIISLLSWVITPVYLAFFLLIPKLRPGSLSPESFSFFREETAKDLIYLIREFFELVVLFFRGQLLISLFQGILFAIGFSLIGLEYGIILGLILGFLNIVPFLGSMVGLSVCLPLAWFQDGGGMHLVLLALAVFAIVQAIEGYFLTPKIMGDRTGLNPLTIIIAIFFWGAALDGILGMILAIPLTAFLVVFWRLAREKYMGQIF
ncbi:MAG: AI-2E family transporter [Gammaproteobacteria bacterium]|nr:AI-2E family transporter [Gammaproteobacteria bacterium]